ncbi:hypothetical protein FH608_019235 [Nonomuraea phyllanthi]|uniref:Uncharacterized protein n=1 Tax=Nonomuraea phyllanthi TaxID=2219224 RepID=A0A5C4WIW7_9ACTN|nr:hypothetical protein [Nonomuraea phyllanthi]KAB8194288.1 hypothetical protein FH608_019235 [Nonomuraea phyllanthi]
MHARALLALDEDPHVQRKVTELMLSVLKDTRTLPAVEGVRRNVRTRHRLRVSDVAGMFDAIEEFNDVIATERGSGEPARVISVRYRRPVGPATMHRIRATLRYALNIAIRQERLIGLNPAAVVELPDAERPKALVWSDERVADWNRELHDRLGIEQQRRGDRRNSWRRDRPARTGTCAPGRAS